MRPDSSRLLIDEPPLLVLPSLALVLGLNEAIFLQQLHYWLRKSGKPREDQTWIYNTYEEWHTQLPFWSVMTIRRIVGTLEGKGIVLSTTKFNSMKIDKTKWYAIDYVTLNRLVEAPDHVINLNSREDQDEQSDVINLNSSVPETTDETNNKREGLMTIEEIEEHERRHQELLRWTHPEKFRAKKS